MRQFLRSVAFLGLAGVCMSLQAQTVTIEDFAAWSTQRNDVIVVKAQLDTMQLAKKKIKVTLSKMENGKKKALATKSQNVTSATQEFNFGPIGMAILGGKNFLAIDWMVEKDASKGSVAPLGIFNLDKVSQVPDLVATAVAENPVDSMVAGTDFAKVGAAEVSLNYNKTKLYIVVKNNPAVSSIVFAFDGKQGKNAFVSYADRFVSCSFADKSVKPVCLKREFSADTIAYKDSPWVNTISGSFGPGAVVIAIPLVDLGFAMFDNRRVGFSVFVKDQKAKTITSFPAQAQELVPGTWGNFICKK